MSKRFERNTRNSQKRMFDKTWESMTNTNINQTFFLKENILATQSKKHIKTSKRKYSLKRGQSQKSHKKVIGHH